MKQLLFPLLFLPCLALAQYPANAGQKITLGEQTTADGLVFRGVASADTVAATSKITRANKQDTSVYLLLDTTTNLLYHYKIGSNGWSQAGGSTFDTTTLNLTSRFAVKLNISDTSSMLTPYFRDADTISLNLTSRFAEKQNNLTLTTTGSSGAATLIGATLNIPQYSGTGGVSDGDKGDIDVTNSGATWTIDTSAISLSGVKVTGTLPVANGGTGAATFTTGNILFGNGTSAINTSGNLYYDVTNNRLGIGATPAHILDLRNNINGTNTIQLSNTSTGGSALHGIICTQEVSINDKWGGFFYTNSGYTGPVGTASTFFMEGAGTGGLYIGTRDASGIIRFASGNRTERMRLNSNGEFNIGYGATYNGAYPLQVNGQIFATNATVATPSDKKYKENILPLNKGLEIVNKLKPVTFNFISDTKNNFSEYEEVGFIAQDIDRALSTETFAKSIVKQADDSDPNSTYLIGTGNLIPILVKAIQEQQALIKALEQRILTLENK